MNEILDYFNKIDIRLTDENGQLRDSTKITEDIVKVSSGHERLVALNKLATYINVKKG